MDKDKSGPAFPSSWSEVHLGLSKREWFAGRAMQGQIAWEGMEGTDVEKNAAMAREYADALLKELEKNG